jgi:hypothetical protein
LPAALVAILALAAAIPVHADHPAAPDLPRHLELGEVSVDAPALTPPSLQLALSAALQSVAERMLGVPNPYSFGCLGSAGNDFPAACRSLPERLADSIPDDPNEVIGVALAPGAVMGLHVDLVGPVELPETCTRLTNPKRDPTDLRNVQTSFGIRLGF